MYDPTIGEFITEDPIGFEAGDANLRRYVGNSPTNGTDPSGTVKRKSIEEDDTIRYWYDYFNAEKNGINACSRRVLDSIGALLYSGPRKTIMEIELEERTRIVPLPTAQELDLPNIYGSDDTKFRRRLEEQRHGILIQTEEGRAQLWRENAASSSATYPVALVPLPPEAVSNRIHAGAQIVVGSAEEVVGFVLIVSPDPALSKVGGGALCLHGGDKIYTYYEVLKSGQLRPTTLHRVTTYAAQNWLEMDRESAQLVGTLVDTSADLAAGLGTAKGIAVMTERPLLVDQSRRGATLTIKQPRILSDTRLTDAERGLLQKHFRIKAGSIRRAADRGELVWSPGTDSVRIPELQAAHRLRVAERFRKMFGRELDMTGLNADHPVDLLIGGSAHQRLRMLSEPINKSIGSTLLEAGQIARLRPGQRIVKIVIIGLQE